MKDTFLRVLRLFMGLFLYAAGIVLTINANLGLAPWDVFHQGISRFSGLTMGQAGIAAGFVILLINSFFGERLGWGTVSNMIFIGLFIDLLMFNNVIPTVQGLVPGFAMIALGMFVIGVASYFYMSAGLGAGVRDGLMVALVRKTGKSVRFVRNGIEICVLAAGYFMGGHVGIGTVVVALGIGYFVQFSFKVFKFNVSTVKHRYIDEDIKFIMDKFLSKGKKEVDIDLE